MFAQQSMPFTLTAALLVLATTVGALQPSGDTTVLTVEAHGGSRVAKAKANASFMRKDSLNLDAVPATAATTATEKPKTLEDELKGYGVDTSNYTAGATHTWGKEKNNLFGLPGWAAVLIAGAAAAFIMIIFSSIGARLAHPLPFFASEEHLMKDRIEIAREKVRALEAAVEAKKAQEQYEKDEEERKAREATDGPSPTGPSHDELVGEMLYRTQEVQRQAVGAVNDSIKQAAPLLARAAHVQDVFKKTVHEVQGRGAEMALKEATNLYGKLKEATGGTEDGATLASLTVQSSIAQGTGDLPEWFKFNSEDTSTDPPPIALLLSGMFAPAQLKMARSQSNSQIIWNSTMLAVCTACLTIDANHHCPDVMIWFWVYGMLVCNALDVICCSFIASRCASTIGALSDDEDATARIKKTGNVIWDSYILLQANSGHFFKAYFAYQNVVDSYVYTFQKFITFISTLWGCVGLWVSMEDIVEDSLSCDAKVVLWFMHTYSFCFLLFITWSIVGLVLWALKRASSLKCVSVPLLGSAKEMDDEVPFKMPVFQTLVRAFLLRDNNTMLLVKAGQLQDEVAALEAEIAETQTKMTYRQQYLKELEYKQKQAAKNEKKLVDQYKEKVIESGGTLAEISGVGSSAAAFGDPSSTSLEQSTAAEPLLEAGSGLPSSSGLLAGAGLDWQATLAQSQGFASSAASSVTQAATSAAESAQAAAGDAPVFSGSSSADAAPPSNVQDDSTY